MANEMLFNGNQPPMAQEERENMTRLRRRRASASKRRVTRRQGDLDFIEMESIPAITRMKSRAERRDNRGKTEGFEPTRSWKDTGTKARAQWARHMDLPCRRHVNPKSKQAMAASDRKEQDGLAALCL